MKGDSRRLEKTIEANFTKWCQARKIPCLKLELRGHRGFPDRTVLLPGGRVVFLEFKNRTGKPSIHQLDWINRLESLGFKVSLVRSIEEAKEAIGDLL